MSSLVTNALRCKDLLNIQFEFINLAVDATNTSTPRLRRAADGPAFIVIRLPPQHIAEEAFTSSTTTPPPFKAFLSSPSRIAFELPKTIAEIMFTLDDVMHLLTELAPITADLPGD